MPALAAIVLLAQVATSPPRPPPRQASLRTAAAASPRPTTCEAGRGATGGERDTLWDRARQPGLAVWCRALARGYARLSRSPTLALAAARDAERAVPGRPGPAVLSGRALLAEGDAAAAYKQFARALALSRRSVEEPAALHDLAMAAELTGHTPEALGAYRALVPRAGLLDDSQRRERVYVEAASLVMSTGESGLNEAIGYLGEARRRGGPPGFVAVVLADLALALDRQGRSEEARGVVAEAGGPWALAELAGLDDTTKPAARARRALLPVLPRGELSAMVAILAERDDPELARDQWRACVAANPKGAWADYARAKLAKAPPRAARRGGH